jgi:hypothetical protein
MPLIQGKSKKAFSENVSREMEAGKPQKQSLAIAYNIKRQNSRKKMAAGGEVISAATEKRPGTQEEFADAMDARQNSGNAGYRKPADWISEEDTPENEIGGNRSGKAVTDMAPQHNNGRAPYAAGGRVKDTGMGLMERNDEDDLLDSMSPDGNRMEQPKGAYDETQERITSGDPDEPHPHTGETQEDMMRRHAMEMEHFMRGGEVGNPKLQQSHLEPDEGDNLVQEIMKGRKHKMAGGGKVRSDQGIGQGDSMFDFPQDDGEVDLEGNSKEDRNNEDQMSYRAAGKEQYNLRQLSKQPKGSNEKGDMREEDSENVNDEGDVAQIRSKMKKRAK